MVDAGNGTWVDIVLADVSTRSPQWSRHARGSAHRALDVVPKHPVHGDR